MKQSNNHLVFIDLAACYGGGEAFLINLLKHIKNKRANISQFVILSNKASKLASEVDKLAISYKMIKTPPIPQYILRPLKLIRTIISILNLTSSGNKELLFSNNFRAHILSLCLTFFRKKIFTHCILHDFMFPKYLVKIFSLHPRISFIPISISLLKHYNLKNKFILPNGFDFDSISIKNSRKFISHKFTLPEDRPWIIGVGNFSRWKGIETFVHTAKLSGSTNMPNKPFFIWIGSRSTNRMDYYENIKKRIDHFSLENIRIIPPTKYFYDILGNSNVYVSCSLSKYGGPESFGRVLIEAMHLRVPVITTNVGEPPNYILNENNGYTVNCESPRELLNKIQRCLNNDYANRIIRNNAYRTSLKYSAESSFKVFSTFFY